MSNLQYINYFLYTENIVNNNINATFSIQSSNNKDSEIRRINHMQLISRSYYKYSFWNSMITYIHSKYDYFIRDNILHKDMRRVICLRNILFNAFEKRTTYEKEHTNLIRDFKLQNM